jgi:ubiquinone/menaquinone biosynthesis C-methylase UbiE
VLEIGSGPGELLFALARRVPGVDLLGIDPDPAVLRIARRKAARRRLPVRFELAYADSLPVADASLDRVLSSYMLHHLQDDQKLSALREIKRVLRPGGQLHVVDAYGGSHGRTRLTRQAPEDVLEAMRSAGLEAAENGRGNHRGLVGHYAFYRAVV